VWWWNPIYWLLSAELRRVREERCDDAVLARGLSTPLRYSHTIIDVAASAHAFAGVQMAAHPLEPRLRRIADSTVPRPTRLTAAQLIALILAALVLLPGVARSPQSTSHTIHIHQH
jgi:beta-lactamase regulating signal transducer with metallopeptidase domain